MSSSNNNPGNFANRPKEEVSEIGRKGGQSSHSGGFASMDPDKQVIGTVNPSLNSSEILHLKAERQLKSRATPTTFRVRRPVKLDGKEGSPLRIMPYKSVKENLLWQSIKHKSTYDDTVHAL